MSEFREISFVGSDLAPYVMFPAAIGGAIAGIAGHRKTAYALLGVALAAAVLPVILGFAALLADPSFD